MKKKIMMVAMAAAMLPAFAMAADVGGVWVRDAKSDPFPDYMYWLTRGVTSGGGGGGNQEFVLTVKKEGGNLIVTNPNRKLRSVALDGQPKTVKTDTGIQNATVTAVDSPAELVITTKQPFGGMPGNAELTVKETWTVSPDGKVLTVTSTRQLPARTAVDKQIFNRRS
jgi:hypothetical protein